MSGFQRVVEFRPAFDKRNADPHKNYGIHGVDMRMVLVGDRGAAQFVLYTGWHLPHVVSEFKASGRSLGDPLPADLGYHSREPRYEGQTAASESCEYLGGCPCYYDGSGLNAERVFDALRAEGGEAVWRELEDFYNQIFAEET